MMVLRVGEYTAAMSDLWERRAAERQCALHLWGACSHLAVLFTAEHTIDIIAAQSTTD